MGELLTVLVMSVYTNVTEPTINNNVRFANEHVIVQLPTIDEQLAYERELAERNIILANNE
jgi:hypothetical protein